MTSPQLPRISSPIEDKLGWALSVYRESGGKLLAETPLAVLLDRLRHAALTCRHLMAELGIAELCRQCEQTEGGSCCAAGIENKYDGRLLLINLLLGVQLPETRPDQQSCFFLGEGGCVLLAREVICINYLCGQVTRQIEPRHLLPLRQSEGEQLDALFSLQVLMDALLKQLCRP